MQDCLIWESVAFWAGVVKESGVSVERSTSAKNDLALDKLNTLATNISRSMQGDDGAFAPR